MLSCFVCFFSRHSWICHARVPTDLCLLEVRRWLWAGRFLDHRPTSSLGRCADLSSSVPPRGHLGRGPPDASLIDAEKKRHDCSPQGQDFFEAALPSPPLRLMLCVACVPQKWQAGLIRCSHDKAPRKSGTPCCRSPKPLSMSKALQLGSRSTCRLQSRSFPTLLLNGSHWVTTHENTQHHAPSCPGHSCARHTTLYRLLDLKFIVFVVFNVLL